MLAELASGVRERRVSGADLVTMSLERIEKLDPSLNSVVAVRADLALADARALDERVAQGVANVALQQQLVRRLERMMELQQIAADAARRQLAVGQGAQLDADSAQPGTALRPQSLMLTFLGNYVLGRDVCVYSGSVIEVFARTGVGEPATRSTLMPRRRNNSMPPHAPT